MAKIPCPCDPNKSYSHCCEAFHQGDHYPHNQETLMRSRYSAYVLGLKDYLKLTWHSSTCPVTFDDMDAVKWLGLKICDVTQDLEQKEHFVEFIARYKDSRHNGQADKIHELSRFIEEYGRLVYIDGIFK